MTDILNIAHGRINALGGSSTDPFWDGYNTAIDDALKVIEALGGRDPLSISPNAEHLNAIAANLNAIHSDVAEIVERAQ